MPNLTEILATHWGLGGARLTPLPGGMNSQTWLVEHDRAIFVAKSVVPAAAAALVAGTEVATMLARAGLVTGRPVPTLDGQATLADPPLALLEHVPGHGLEGETEEEQRWIAGTLAAVHRAGGPAPGPPVARFALDWLSPAAPGVADHPWVGAVVESVRAETDSLALTWSLLHTDPAPEAFLHDDATGVTGLVDWAGARRGPVLYDVASAVMYLGGHRHAAAFLDAYRSLGPLSPEEMQHLGALRRFREAVQAVYFAGRLAAVDLTGGIDPSENQRGLDDARRRLEGLGVATGQVR